MKSQRDSEAIRKPVKRGRLLAYAAGVARDMARIWRLKPGIELRNGFALYAPKRVFYDWRISHCLAQWGKSYSSISAEFWRFRQGVNGRIYLKADRG